MHYTRLLDTYLCSHKMCKLIRLNPHIFLSFPSSLIVHTHILLSFNYLLDYCHYSSSRPNYAISVTTHLRCICAEFGTPKIFTLVFLHWNENEDDLGSIFSNRKQRIHISFMFRLATKCISTLSLTSLAFSPFLIGRLGCKV